MCTCLEYKKSSGDQCPNRDHASQRRGLALVVVLFVIAFSLTLGYSFLQLQTISVHTRANRDRVARALSAARAGALLALYQMSSPDWSGVDQPFRQVIEDTPAGQAVAEVSFHPVQATARETPAAAALELIVRSRGVWRPANAQTSTVRTVELLARLRPRVPPSSESSPNWEALESTGGSSRELSSDEIDSARQTLSLQLSPVDSSPSDVSPIPEDFQLAQWFTIAALGLDRIELNPGTRAIGPVWLNGDFKLYRGVDWPGKVRDQVLVDLGTAYGVDLELGRPSPVYPHPLSGLVIFGQDAKGKADKDLEKLRVAVNHVNDSIREPTWTAQMLTSYRLFQGGFVYQALSLPPTLRHTKLTPTSDNPLGLFYRAGDLELADDVVVHGTLVVTGTVRITGEGVYVGSLNWLDPEGRPIQKRASIWPRLSAIVASRVEFDSDAFAVIEGAVVASDRVKRSSSSFSFVDAGPSELQLTGTATAKPQGRPYSQVQLHSWTGSSLLKLQQAVEQTRSLNANLPISAYWLRFDDGVQMRWFPVVAVQPTSRRLLVVGELRLESPQTFQLQVRRQHFVQIFGPVVTKRFAAKAATPWLLSSEQWTDLWNQWKAENSTFDGGTNSASAEDNAGSSRSFLEFLADPSNFSGWGQPYSSYGLRMDPTFVVCRPQTTLFQLAPPLFRPFMDLAHRPDDSGYRWEVLSWREQR